MIKEQIQPIILVSVLIKAFICFGLVGVEEFLIATMLGSTFLFDLGVLHLLKDLKQ